MKFEANEAGPGKDLCKVRGCRNTRIKSKRVHAFCKAHSGLRTQIKKSKFKELATNNEVVVL